MSERAWRFYLNDMIGFAEKVLSYTVGFDQARFEADGLTYDATVRNLELLGEAASHIPSEVREAHPEIHWRQVIATRNRLIHGYLGIDNDILWSIVEQGHSCLTASASGSQGATGMNRKQKTQAHGLPN